MTPSAELGLVPRRKVQLPRPSAAVVLRPRLDAVLDEATRGPATLVSAPAGFGKTLLVASWARREVIRRPVAWVALDRADNDRQRLWSAVVAALTSAGVLVPAGADELGGMLVRGDPDVVATLVDVLDDVAQPHVLVLDDVHELVDADVLRELTTLVRSRPRGLHLVVSGRRDPPLHLGRLRLAGELVEVRSELIRFTVEETRRLAVLHGVDLTDAQVRMLTAGTEGWPVGLRLAVVALCGRREDERDLGEFLERLLDADPTIADYLTGEVLDDLDDGVLPFLRVISVTDELPVSLAVALSGRADAGALLARLALKTALITSTGATDPEYRVHGLLRSYLRADLDREQPELVDGLHRAAAQWYEERGLLGSALDHARRAGNRAWTASFLMRNALELYLRGDFGAVPASVRHIVGADKHTAPALAHVGALVDLATGRLSTVTARNLAAVDATEGVESLLAELVASQAAVLMGRRWDGAGVARPHESWAQVASGWTALLAGELGRARDELDVAEELSARMGHDVPHLQVHVARAVLEFLNGRYPAMDEPCAAAATLARERGWPSSPWLAAARTLQAFRALQLTETERALSSVAAADRAHSVLLPAGMALLAGGQLRPVRRVRQPDPGRDESRRRRARCNTAHRAGTFGPRPASHAALARRGCSGPGCLGQHGQDPRPRDLHQVRGHQPPPGRHGWPESRAVVEAVSGRDLVDGEHPQAEVLDGAQHVVEAGTAAGRVVENRLDRWLDDRHREESLARPDREPAGDPDLVPPSTRGGHDGRGCHLRHLMSHRGSSSASPSPGFLRCPDAAGSFVTSNG
jgi:LuxR family transcriptional regulator, maltose regulon positive regulatory protein